MGVVLYRLERRDEAARHFRRAVELRGEDLLALNLIDVLEAEMSRYRRLESETAQSVQTPSVPSLKEWEADSSIALHQDLQSLSDGEWFQVLFRSVSDRRYKGHLLPGFVSEELQRKFVGSSGEWALLEAANFFRFVLLRARQHGVVGDGCRVVDFGCGWGRYTRFLLKYYAPSAIYGLDVDPAMVEHCRRSVGNASFLGIESMPPCDLRDRVASLVFGYSVFSHLSQACADAWIEEFARILRPGGIAIMTTQGRAFIDFCADIRRRNDLSNSWFVSLSTAFLNSEQAIADYDAGGFVHHGDGMRGGTYGETVISKGYIESSWCRHFELVEFIDDPAQFPQTVFVLRRL